MNKRLFRQRIKLQQQELCKKMKCGRSSMYMYENDNWVPHIEWIERYIDILGLTEKEQSDLLLHDIKVAKKLREGK